MLVLFKTWETVSHYHSHNMTMNGSKLSFIIKRISYINMNSIGNNIIKVGEEVNLY